ncbi:MAG: hypothetical protein JKY03_01380 [Aureispira sp.]|nr:hypothetical protein [Aureispira sp.]
MSHKLFLLSAIILFNYTFLNAQTKEEMLFFYNKFEPIEFDLLHIYTNGPQEKSTYNPKSSYPFKGKAIVSSRTPFLEKLLDIDAGKDFFALYRYSITTQVEGLIIRMYDKETLSNSIYTLVYHHKTNTLEEGIQLAHDYQAEGGSGAIQSWLLDLNEDGLPDVLTRSYYDRYDLKQDSDDLEHIHKEESYLVIFDNLIFNNTLIHNRDLQKNLEKEFPYRSIQAPFMQEQTQKAVLKMLKKGGLVIPSEQD